MNHEIKKFTNIAYDWWNPSGKFRPLHQINFLRIEYIKSKILENYPNLKGLKILDVGCVGGLVSIPLARLGASVTAIDAGAENIEAAKSHYESLDEELQIKFEHKKLEDIDEIYDVVICLEVIEHVENYAIFLQQLVSKTENIMILSTINRNLKSYILGIVAAEYILRWVPAGTHEYSKFLKPSEIAAALPGYQIKELRGIEYDIWSRDFKLSKNIDVNYICTIGKK